MITLAAGLVGLLFGVIGSYLYFHSRVSLLTSALDTSSRSASSLEATLVRERQIHDETLSSMSSTFEGLSSKVVTSALEQFTLSQMGLSQERDSKLALTLRPLEDLLKTYRDNVDTLSRSQSSALIDVSAISQKLLETQQASLTETRRLSRVLGRGDHRGRWGELQLENVLAASGLLRGVDYELQASTVSPSGRALRPDAVVRMPSEGSLAIDAKFPFDSFEAAISTEDPATHRSHLISHAAALRSHVKTLSDKAYWSSLDVSPEFVVCFVPSDAAVSAALTADSSLHSFAAKSRVIIAGPSSLLSLLWTAALVLRSSDATLNAREILAQAETLIERIRLVAEPVAKMGESLELSVAQYNKLVSSVETRLLPAARQISDLGVNAAKPVPELSKVATHPTQIQYPKWAPVTESLFSVPVDDLEHHDQRLLD